MSDEHDLTDDEMRIFRDEGIIPVIKALRERTGLGLREAKEVVDRFRNDYTPRKYQHSDAEIRIRVALSNMPYGGTIQRLRDTASRVGIRDGTPSTIEMSDVAAYLEAMVQVLGEHSVEETAHREQFHRLESDVAAVRRIFGDAYATAFAPDAERSAMKRAQTVRKRSRKG